MEKNPVNIFLYFLLIQKYVFGSPLPKQTMLETGEQVSWAPRLLKYHAYS